MIRVKIIRACAIKGEHVSTGDSVELADAEAQELIDMGKAVRVESNRAIGLKKSDGPKMKTRKQ
jgi:predicted RNase H-like HicB family nuclease|tara:strand:+ start:457 stop:648 length:192 start_codon:yes stop_codon:yes gene_type:complete